MDDLNEPIDMRLKVNFRMLEEEENFDIKSMFPQRELIFENQLNRLAQVINDL